MVENLNLDYETFSKVDLKKSGVYVYAEDESTEVLMAAYSLDFGPVKQWVPAEGEKMPFDLYCALNDPKVTKRAHNAQFERLITKHVLGIDIPFHEWRCSMVLAMSLSLPGSLGMLGEAVRLSEDKKKMTRGKALIRKFCTPRKPTKTMKHRRCNRHTDYDDWVEFKEYNVMDVVAEKAILKKIIKWDLSQDECDYFNLDQKINDRGIPVNRDAVENAIEIVEDLYEDKLGRMKELTGLANPNSGPQLLPWLKEQGYPFDDLKAAHIQEALKQAEDMCEATCGEDESDNLYHEVLYLKSQVSKTSIKKYASLHKGLSKDDTMKGAFQFVGASRTGRFSGRRFQPQNLAKASKAWEDRQEEMSKDLEILDLKQVEEKYGNPIELLSGAVRTVVQPGPGKLVVGADLNAIENRVLGWVCGDDKILGVFHDGRCPYVDFATYMFGGDYATLYEEYKPSDGSPGNSKKRTTAKPGVLGAGYGLSAGYIYEDKNTGEQKATGLLGYAWAMGIKDMDEDMAALSIRTFRDTYSGVTNYWRKIENAAKMCIMTRMPQKAGMLEFSIEGPFLRMRLPSGRYLSYYKPRMELKKMPWGDMKKQITYEGMNDVRKWTRIQTYYGKLVENAVQAIARDLLLEGMRKADKAGLDIFMHVHDEIVVSSSEEKAEQDMKILIECMTEKPSWAQDLPLGAGGSISTCFIKD